MAKRQKNGTGTTIARKDGSFEYRVSIGIGMDGKPLRKSFYGRIRKEAVQKYKDWLKDSNNIAIEKVSTVGEWAEKWLTIYKRDKVAYKSYKNYELYVKKHIIPNIGHLRLESVRPAHIAELYKKEIALSASALRHISIALNGIFDTAVENHLCKENPSIKAKPPHKFKSPPEVFTSEEVSKLLAYAPSHKWGSYISTLLYTGLRMGELLALQWNDVCLDKMTLNITKTVAEVENIDAYKDYKRGERIKQKKKYEIKNTPKSEKERTVVLTPNGVELLRSIPKEGKHVLVGGELPRGKKKEAKIPISNKSILLFLLLINLKTVICV